MGINGLGPGVLCPGQVVRISFCYSSLTLQRLLTAGWQPSTLCTASSAPTEGHTRTRGAVARTEDNMLTETRVTG